MVRCMFSWHCARCTASCCATSSCADIGYETEICTYPPINIYSISFKVGILYHN